MKLFKREKQKKRTLYFYDIPLTKENLFYALYILAVFIAICILLDTMSRNSDDLVWYLMLFLCFCAWCYHKQRLDDKQNLYRKISWIYGKNSGELILNHLRDSELVEYIEFEQRKQNISVQYCIDFSNKTEKDNLTKILNSHKDHSIESYFCNKLNESKDIYNLNSLEYYFFSLDCYVANHLNEYNACEAYGEREHIPNNNYNIYKRRLTDYGRVYYKLNLITQLYIENNENIQRLYTFIDKEKKNNIMEILNNNEACFFK